jgi:plasmid stabilization system protein ParE
MSFRVVHEAAAKAEFREAIACYEEQTEGRGVRFVGKVDEVMAAVAAQPFRFPKAGRHGRKARVLGWPYSIFFTINEEHREVKVVAVWHGKRNPAELRRRLK